MVTGAEVAGLKWVADFLKSILGAVAGDRLKKKTSPDKAQEYAFKAYRALAGLKKASAEFVSSLEQLPAVEAFPHVENAIQQVSEELETLGNALKRVDPQLDIHAPETSSLIEEAQATRRGWLSRATVLIREFAREGPEPENLAAVIEGALQTQVQIEAAVESLRAFLASEFTFKESF